MKAPIPGGYIILARKILESDLMDRPPLYVKLWVWMLEEANFKDREKLKRGQLVTTIAGMQEAMSYRIGYRKITPSRDQIRSAYEAFTKATMITITKTTRGMIITVCKYDHYQNPKNYEAHNENATKPTVIPHGTEECNKNEKKGKRIFSSDSAEIRLSKRLLDHILFRNPNHKKPDLQKWAKDIDLAIRKDNRNLNDMEIVIDWCQKDPFWQNNILSTATLRRKFDQLFLKMEDENGGAKNKRQSYVENFGGTGSGSQKYAGPGESLPAAG